MSRRCKVTTCLAIGFGGGWLYVIIMALMGGD